MSKNKENKKKFGDRRDARKVRGMDPFHLLMIQVKPKRADSDVYINRKIDVTKVLEYIEQKKKENPEEKISIFHAICCATAKVVYNRPLMNRFIANGNFYDRDDVLISFVAKTSFTDDAEEFMTKIKMEEDYTFSDVRKAIQEKVDRIRKSEKGSTDGAINLLGKMPTFLRKIVVGVLISMEKRGRLPHSITDDLIYYSTVIMSNLGSIDCGAIYHNITNFGTNSILMTIGKIRDEKVLMPDGTEKIRKMCEFGVNLDERIADGFYFVQAINMMDYVLNHPEMLEDKLNTKIVIEK